MAWKPPDNSHPLKIGFQLFSSKNVMDGSNTPKNLVVDSEMALALTDPTYMVADRLDGLLHP